MRQDLYKEALELVSNRQYQQAMELVKEIIEGEERDSLYYITLKLYADLVGPIAYKDYFTAIETYQHIINECEDDLLYEQCQIGILTAYLNLSVDMLDAYDSTRDVLESENDQIIEMLSALDSKRDEFIMNRAEIIHKRRM